jgi:hypothetical protein
MSSDSTGEVYMIERENGEKVNDVSVATIEAIGG